MLLTIGAMAQGPEVPVESEITDVTVFLSGAQVTREAEVTIPSGNSTLVFEGLTQYLNANSIQVKGTSAFTIISVNSRSNYENIVQDNPEVDRIMTEMEELQFKIDQRNAMRMVYEEERNMMLQNQHIVSEQEGLDLDDLAFYADFYRERLMKIEYELIEIDDDVTELSQERQDLQYQLNELTANPNLYTSHVLVNVQSNRGTTAKIQLNYVVSNAGWYPYYDVRAEDLKSSIALTYKASVYQGTGNNWENVNVTLSTGNPNQSGTPPVINPWVLSFASEYSNMNYDKNANYGYQLNTAAPVYDTYVWGAETGGSLAAYTSVSHTTVTTEFETSVPYSIPTDGQYHDVEIAQHALAVDYNYYSVPKLDDDAFLLAKVHGWEQYDLLAGYANVYFKGTYVGQSYMNTQTTADTLELSLGRDQDIVINRDKVKDFTKHGSKNKVTVTMEISIRNTKSVTITMDLEDQVPISQLKELEITVLDDGGASFDENRGQLMWDVILGPGETQTFTFSYEIKYPKDMQLSNF